MHKAFFVSLAFLLAMATPAAADVVYTPNGGNDATYSTLHDLQTAHSTLGSGDKITFMNDDGTLQNAFTLHASGILALANGAAGQLTISAAPNSTIRFLYTSGDATINWGSRLTFSGFSAGDGGAVYVGGDLGGITGSTFNYNNADSSGGAVYVGGNLGGITDSTFSYNSAYSSGGAVYVNGDLYGITDSTFSGNSANEGGAVYVWGNLADSISYSIFTDNSAYSSGGAVYVNVDLYGITDSTFTGNAAAKGNGGAVYVNGDLYGITDSTFSENSASAGNGGAVSVRGNLNGITDSTFSSNSADYNGGAVYVAGDLYGITGSTFSNNSASAGNGGAVFVDGDLGGITGSTFSNNSASNGYGGAVYVWDNLTGGITGSTFSNNSASNGYGGAVYVWWDLAGGITGSTFSNNSANEGGALYVLDDLTGGITGSTFSNNSASGRGGALYVWGNVALSGAGASFIGNQATGVAGNADSGLGGAIFHDAEQSYVSPAKTFSINATAGDAIVFEGNTHNPGQSGQVPNSIYFGNGAASGKDGQVNATFNVAEGGALHMLDPMASQEDDFISGSYGSYGNLALNIDKTGPGVWVLAGHNYMQSAANWVVSEGSLHLVADSQGNPAHIMLANTTNAMGVADYASFTLKSGATLLLEPTASPHQISGQSIALESGSDVGLAGFQYGPKLDTGQYTVLKLNAPNISNNSGLLSTSGTITVGVNNYDYNNLKWRGDELIMNLGAPSPDPALSGAPSITGASHIAALNPAFNAFSNRAKGLFGVWSDLPYTEYASGPALYASADTGAVSDAGSGYTASEKVRYLNRLWITPTYVNAHQSGGGNKVGYRLQTPGLALGYDRQISENAFLGAGVSLSRPDYSGGDTDIEATDVTFAIYGGARLPYALELDAHAGFGFTRYDQDRKVHGEHYSEKYDGRNFFMGLGLGRAFDLGGGFSLRPGAAYDYIRLDTDGFNEGAGTYAIKADDYSQNLHRVKAGFDLNWTSAESGLSVGGEAYYLGVYGDRKAETAAHFVNDPVNGFTMLGNGLDRDNLGLGLKVALPVAERWELGAGYNVLFGRDTVSQQGMLTATFKF